MQWDVIGAGTAISLHLQASTSLSLTFFMQRCREANAWPACDLFLPTSWTEKRAWMGNFDSNHHCNTFLSISISSQKKKFEDILKEQYCNISVPPLALHHICKRCRRNLHWPPKMGIFNSTKRTAGSNGKSAENELVILVEGENVGHQSHEYIATCSSFEKVSLRFELQCKSREI